ncbi:MAG: hypothetical protein ABI687_08640 [Flavitalea sp.]
MNRILIMAIISVLFQVNAVAQGCVAIRSTGSSCSLQKPGEDAYKWQFNANYRYFKSFRHFKGKEEQKERLVDHSDVRNYSHSLDLSIVRQINPRWSLALNVPLLVNHRSSLYEHGLVNGVYVKKERGVTSSYGLGDMRFSAYYWLFDPFKSVKGNIQLGMGIKFATGDYNYQDYWTNVGPNGSKELRTVDQSIQLGDGGTGLSTELNAYYNIIPELTVYANGFYLINPRDANGTRTYRETLSPALYNETIMSVADQYLARVGFSYMVKKFSFSAGGRIDGIPVHDLAGNSNGFRRPGYAIAIEPGISYTTKKNNWYLNVPIAVSRNRTQSVTDKERSAASGTFQQGDAAFADYVINIGCAFKF